MDSGYFLRLPKGGARIGDRTLHKTIIQGLFHQFLKITRFKEAAIVSCKKMNGNIIVRLGEN